MCVENDESVRGALVNTLRYYFHAVYEASNGEEGYEIYEENRPDIVLTDIKMPKKTGIEMVESIRAHNLDIIIVALTAYSDKEYLLKLINLKINHYILKPIYTDKLLDGIIKAFGNTLAEHLSISEELYFDTSQYELVYKGEVIVLKKREKEFLILLCRNKHRVITYQEIEDCIWEYKYMSPWALKTFIKELRYKLPVACIVNIQQTGYRFEVAVS